MKDERILLGKKSEDKYKDWIFPPNSWANISSISNDDWMKNYCRIHVKSTKNQSRLSTIEKLIKIWKKLLLK